ncbi:hypothetical protein Tco_0940694 [Tanacetum coccineum]|uniref:Uncharacterized protein n=1 Tax=Tanacetum coccineum TaxID=301880 RepID=A0ABQ5DUS7_9ASTR
MSTPVIVDLESYLDGTDTESEPFEDPIDTETPLTVAPPTSLPESTPPTLVPILCRTARMVVRVPPAMSSGLSASMAKVAAMYESAFLEDSEEDDDEEDEEIEESLDFDSVSEDAEDEGPTAEDEDPAVGDEGLAAGVEGPSMDDESHGLDDESRGLDDEGHSGSRSAPESERPERVSASRQPTLTTWTDPEDGIVYIDVTAYPPSVPPVQTPPSLEWTSGLVPISPSPSVVHSPVSSPMISLTVSSLVATPATAKTKGFLTELGAQVEMQGGSIRDHVVRLEELSPALFERYARDIGELFTRLGAVRDGIFSQSYRFRSLEYEQERVAVTFRVIWRPVLALESWEGQTNAHRATLWHAISDMQGKNQDLRLQLAEERRAPLELAEVVDRMRRGQEPRGDA